MLRHLVHIFSDYMHVYNANLGTKLIFLHFVLSEFYFLVSR